MVDKTHEAFDKFARDLLDERFSLEGEKALTHYLREGWKARGQHTITQLLKPEMVEAVAITQSQWLNGSHRGEPQFDKLNDNCKDAYRHQAQAAIDTIIEQLDPMYKIQRLGQEIEKDKPNE